MNLRLEIGRLVTGLAEYYEKTLTPDQIGMYVEDLLEVTPAELMQACRLYRKDPKNERFPLPGKLLGMIRLPDDQRARDAAGRILTAISRIGNYRGEDAKESIGELGWAIVQAQGGWEEVCKTVTDDNKTTYQAQWRELGISLINKHRLGVTDEAPTLEFKPKQQHSLESISGMLALKEMPR